MSQNEKTLVRKAEAYFKQGNFQKAKTYYQQAAQEYGQHLFAHNIRLCDRRLGGFQQRESIISTADQLQETQRLLEHYYTRSQELEYKLMDKRE